MGAGRFHFVVQVDELNTIGYSVTRQFRISYSYHFKALLIDLIDLECCDVIMEVGEMVGRPALPPGARAPH